MAILFSCQKDNSSDKSVQNLKDKNIIVSNDSRTLSNRIKLFNQLLKVENVTTNLKGLNEPPKVDLTKNYAFKLRAEVDPPVFEGHTLMATHVKILDHYAFVTYNTKGDIHLGGLEVFDVTDISSPKIIWQAVFSKTDVSSVDYYENKIYIVGAQDVTSDTTLKLRTPALLEVLQLNSNREIQKVDTVINLDSYAGTDVKVGAEGIYTTSGSNGFLKIYNHSYDSVYAVAISDARSVGLNTNNAYVLSGQPGKVTVFDRANHSLVNTYSPGGANTPESK